jgi:hypothetical protein
VRVETGVPFESPKLFEINLTDRLIYEKAVDESPVTRDAEGPDAILPIIESVAACASVCGGSLVGIESPAHRAQSSMIGALSTPFI